MFIPLVRFCFTPAKKCANIMQSQQFGVPLFRYCSQSSEYGKQLGGFEYKEEIEPFKSRWRKPYIEREGFWKSKFDLFTNRRFPAGNTKYNPTNFKYFSLSQWWSYQKREKLVFNQQFIQERLNILGCDLAAAHFVVFRGGAVKFYNQSEWVRDDFKKNTEYDDKLPNVYSPGYFVEAIDFSGTQILYEGLQNIENLKKLKWLSFSRCGLFDNWCLDRVSGEYGEDLEYLDISHTNITWHSLSAIYRFKNLKTLRVDDWSDDPKFYFMCAEIKKYYPELSIEGVPTELLSLEDGDENNISDEFLNKLYGRKKASTF